MDTDLAESFLSRSREELHALLAQRHSPEFDSTDGYRALVLLGRMAQYALMASNLGVSQGDGLSVEERAALGADLHAICRPPQMDTLIAVLNQELAVDSGPPTGPLHDAILDIDDRLTVSELLGESATVEPAAQHAVATLNALPMRTRGLAPWARMRIRTCPSQSVVHRLWKTVEQAAKSRPTMLRGTTIPLPLRLELMLAADDQSTEFPPQDLRTEFSGRLYLDQETRELMLDLELASAVQVEPCSPVLQVKATSSAGPEILLFQTPLHHEQDGRDLYVSLGPQSGPNSLLRRAHAAIPSSLDRSEVRIVVWFKDEP